MVRIRPVAQNRGLRIGGESAEQRRDDAVCYHSSMDNDHQTNSSPESLNPAHSIPASAGPEEAPSKVSEGAKKRETAKTKRKAAAEKRNGYRTKDRGRGIRRLDLRIFDEKERLFWELIRKHEISPQQNRPKKKGGPVASDKVAIQSPVVEAPPRCISANTADSTDENGDDAILKRPDVNLAKLSDPKSDAENMSPVVEAIRSISSDSAKEGDRDRDIKHCSKPTDESAPEASRKTGPVFNDSNQTLFGF